MRSTGNTLEGIQSLAVAGPDRAHLCCRLARAGICFYGGVCGFQQQTWYQELLCAYGPAAVCAAHTTRIGRPVPPPSYLPRYTKVLFPAGNSGFQNTRLLSPQIPCDIRLQYSSSFQQHPPAKSSETPKYLVLNFSIATDTRACFNLKLKFDLNSKLPDTLD
eukprot:234862-Rhodomonas_salina.2